MTNAFSIAGAKSPAHERLDPSLARPVAELLDEVTASTMLRDAGLRFTRAVPNYLRHKPGVSSIVSYHFETDAGTTPALGYAHWSPSVERADEIYAKAVSLRPRSSAVGVSVVRVDGHTIFSGFPNDARLRRLRWYSTPRKLKRVLASLVPEGETMSKRASSAEVLKYKPERRLVARVELGTREGSRQQLLLRYTTGRNAMRLAATARALLANGVNSPAPIAQLDQGRVGIDAFIEGMELRSRVKDGGSVAEQLATDLRAFHRSVPPARTPVRLASHHLANAIGGLQTFSLWNVRLGGLAHQVATRLREMQPSVEARSALVHGDLHDKNVLVNDGDVWFIDLERASIGSPASDLGRMRAHGISLAIRQPGWSPEALGHAEEVTAVYRSGAGSSTIIDQHLAWYTAIALVDQALLVTRHVENEWFANAEALLEAALAELGERSTAYPSASASAGGTGSG